MQTTTLHTVEFHKKLHDSGFRVTKTKSEIFDILLNSKKPLSIKEIDSRVKASHFVSVYRSIDVMQKAQVVKLVPQGFKSLFELSDTFKPHHHHATCEKCGKTVEIRSKALEEKMKDISRESGFKPTRHHFELFGICKRCDA